MPDVCEIELQVHPELMPLLRLGLIRAEPVRVGPAGGALLAEVRRVCDDLAAEHAGKAPAEIPGLAAAREFYRAFGIDPTRTRPSSEALLRRVLKRRPFPEIVNAVDVGNLCSLRSLLPLGLYDAGKIEGCVTLRRGRAGESYPGIRKEEVHLAGRPVLADACGAFGNPTSDSNRTSVTLETESLWMVIFAPASVPREAMESHVLGARELIGRHLAPPDAAVETTGAVLDPI